MAGTSRESYTGACCSIGSLINPGKPESKRTCNSEPFLKPTLSLKNLKDRILKTIQAKIKNPQNDPQQKDFSMEESKCILRKLSTELDRLVPLKGLVMLSEVRNVESPQNESQALDLVLLWADELRSLQNRKCATIQIPVKLKIQPCHEATQNLDKKQQLIDSKIILSDWIRKLKPKESVNVREEQKAVLQDLCKRWKKGQLVDILPIMDFIIRIILWENKSEGNILKEWFKTEEVFHKTGGLCIPVPVWNCITRASAEVILDPNTANPDLKLSKDGCAVRTKTHEECKQNPWDVNQRRHCKFDGWTCVQAIEGYTTGRHYWEVNVQGKCEWRIGVVKESAPRHGYFNMNTTAGYWTLRLQLGSLLALTDPVTKLNQKTPSKIGVYLDLEEGCISFYDSVKRKHIYTFKTHFGKSEKIYPVFGTVETDRALRIM